MDNFSDKVMSSIALSLIFITLSICHLFETFDPNKHIVDDIIYEESLVGEEQEPGHHHAQAEAGDGVAENHQRVLAQGEWRRRNHVLVDQSIFVTLSATTGSSSFTLSVPGQDTHCHFCTAPLYRVIT